MVTQVRWLRTYPLLLLTSAVLSACGGPADETAGAERGAAPSTPTTASISPVTPLPTTTAVPGAGARSGQLPNGDDIRAAAARLSEEPVVLVSQDGWWPPIDGAVTYRFGQAPSCAPTDLQALTTVRETLSKPTRPMSWTVELDGDGRLSTVTYYPGEGGWKLRFSYDVAPGTPDCATGDVTTSASGP